MRKKQNTRRSIAQSIHKLYASGLFVTAGFIIGFDSETELVADAMVELIEVKRLFPSAWWAFSMLCQTLS